MPKQGDRVKVMYKGKLEDGTVFDQSPGFDADKEKKWKPLEFKVGTGRVIRGWDESLMTMTVGEEAVVTIEPHWAYGDKPPEGTKIPKGATLIFEMKLVAAG